MKTYKFEGETFELDDSEGCFVKVTFKGQVAYFGVNLTDGTEDLPYTYAGSWQAAPAADGLSWGYKAGTYQQGLDRACGLLIARQQQIAFDREKACKTLHEETAKLP